MIIKFQKLSPLALVPKRQSEGAAGFDLHALEYTAVSPGQRVRVRTGIAAAIPEHFFGKIFDRSSLASKFGLVTIAGVIDSDYRGEIQVVMNNISHSAYVFEPGERIAQMVVTNYLAHAIEVNELNETERGDGGFGSTGTGEMINENA